MCAYDLAGMINRMSGRSMDDQAGVLDGQEDGPKQIQTGMH